MTTPAVDVIMTTGPAPRWLGPELIATLIAPEAHKWEEISVLGVDCATMCYYNQRYRRATGPTDVLSFAFDPEEGLHGGQIILYHGAIDTYAQKAGLSRDLRWAHILIHALAHLQGLDHQTAEQVAQMWAVEQQYWKRILLMLPHLKSWSFSKDYSYFYQNNLIHKSSSLLE